MQALSLSADAPLLYRPDSSRAVVSRRFPPSPQPSNTFLAFLNRYTASEGMQNTALVAQMTASKRVPNLADPDPSSADCTTEARRHLVAILMSRGPLSDDEVLSPAMTEAVSGTLSSRVWQIVYDLSDLEQVTGYQQEKETLKNRLVKELVTCVHWEPGLDAPQEAIKLVQEVFPP